jgi:hypothetical protein
MPRHAQRYGMHAWTMFQPQLSVSVQWWQKAPGRLAHSLVNCGVGEPSMGDVMQPSPAEPLSCPSEPQRCNMLLYCHPFKKQQRSG